MISSLCESRSEIDDFVGANDPARPQLLITLAGPPLCRRMFDGRLLHPGQIAEVVHVSQFVNFGRLDACAMCK